MKNNKKLSIFNKEDNKWTTGDEIKITDYQYRTLKAIADNYDEKLSNNNEIVLSKKDIDIAINLHKEGKLTKDLSKNLINNYKVENAQRHSNSKAISAYVTNGDNTTSANLVFKYGNSKDAAVKLSSEINKNNNSNKVFSIDEMPEYYQAKYEHLKKSLNITDKELLDKIKYVAKETGYSEYFITHIMCIENFIPIATDIGDNVLTGGFGTTSKRNKLHAGQKINLDEAAEWLIKDLKFFEKQIKSIHIDEKTTFADYFDDIPLCIKEGMLDTAYNRGGRIFIKKEYEDFRKDIKKGDYVSAAVNLRQEFDCEFDEARKNKFTTGLMERNIYRFLLVIRDFSSKDKENAKNKFNGKNSSKGVNKEYYTNARKLKKVKNYDNDSTRMKQAWNATK